MSILEDVFSVILITYLLPQVVHLGLPHKKMEHHHFQEYVLLQKRHEIHPVVLTLQLQEVDALYNFLNISSY